MINLIIPESIDQSRPLLDFRPHEMCIYIPDPHDENRGIYVTRQGFVNLLRANKDNPEAVQYLADMLE